MHSILNFWALAFMAHLLTFTLYICQNNLLKAMYTYLYVGMFFLLPYSNSGLKPGPCVPEVNRGQFTHYCYCLGTYVHRYIRM
jgi:hypothetical protein